MKFKLMSKRLLAGVLTAGSLFAVAACAPSEDPAAIAPTTDAPTATEGYAEDTATTPDATEPGAAAVGEGDTIIDVAASDQSFSTLAQAVEAAGLTETLSQPGPYTLFAPTNEAFDALPEGTVEQLLQPENRDLLTQLLTYHVVPTEVTSEQITAGDVTTVEGSPLTIQVDEAASQVMVNNAMVVQPDIQASNGVIHAIDQIVVPPQLQAQLSDQPQPAAVGQPQS
jgi:uncharacterized surface protein with fasciclin (FAS1) repeats